MSRNVPCGRIAPLPVMLRDVLVAVTSGLFVVGLTWPFGKKPIQLLNKNSQVESASWGHDNIDNKRAVVITAVTSQWLGEHSVHCLSVSFDLHISLCKRIVPILQMS